MPTAGPNLPHQLLLHKAAPTTSHHMLAQTCLCQKLFLFLGKFVFYTHNPTCILWQLHFRQTHYCGRPWNQKDRQTFPAVQQYRCFETDWGINGTRRKSPNDAVHSTQQWQAQGWSDFGCTEAPHPTMLLMWIYVNELIMKPSAYNLQCWHKSSWQLHVYSFFDILITGDYCYHI